MKKLSGKIAVSILVLLVVAAVWLAAVLTLPTHAADPGIRTYTNKHMIRSMVTYPEVVFVEWPTGHVVNVTTGIPALAETFEANEMTDMAQHAESDFWTFTTPPLAGNKQWVMVVCDAAAADGAAETDLAKSGTLCYFYDAKTNCVTDAGFASIGDGVYTRPAPQE